jgi:excisionase family DNA binding protein
MASRQSQGTGSVSAAERVLPPPKRSGQARGRRTLDGTTKDVAALAAMLGTSEGKIRSAVARGLLPYHRWGGRIVFLTTEVEEFLRRLPGVSVDEAVQNVGARKTDGGGGERRIGEIGRGCSRASWN